MSAFIQFPFLSILFVTIFALSQETEFTQDTLHDTHGRIIFSSVLFRHGDRYPANPYPTDPYNESFWPQGLGQLSKKGKLQEYQLGQWFRKRYDSLITNGYRYDLLRINSSDMDRTIMSAECFLAGFLPPTGDEIWSENELKWQPIPIHTIPAQLDTVIGFKRPCEKYDLEKKRVTNSPEMQAFYLEHKRLFDYVAQHAGIEINTNDILDAIDTIWDVYDDLFIEELYNLTIPSWTKPVYPEPLRSVAAKSFSNIAYTLEMRRLKAGPLIGHMVEEMELKIKGGLNETFHFYSGHDTTISVLLTALDIYNGIPPPYSTSVIVELRQKDDDYVVTILYKNTTTSAPYLLQIPGCPHICTLENFKQATAYLVPEDWESECDIGFVNGLSYGSIFELMVMTAVVFLLLILFLSVIKLHIMRRKRYSRYEVIRNDVLNIKDGLLE